MRYNKLALFTIIVLGLTLSTISVRATSQIWVRKANPCKGLGKQDTYWVGELKILTSPNKYGTYTGPYIVYCLQTDEWFLNHKREFDQNFADDTSEWRSISYILTWYHPASTNDEAYHIQAAIWKIRGYNPSWLSSDAGYDLKTEALGKDVIRSGDTIDLKPDSKTTYFTEEVNFIATLTPARANVRIIIEIVEGEGTLSKEEDFTDGDGQVEFTLTTTSVGTVKVKVWTKGSWSYLWYGHDVFQDLVNAEQVEYIEDTWDISTVFFVIPEMPMGTIGAVITMFTAFTFRIKKNFVTVSHHNHAYATPHKPPHRQTPDEANPQKKHEPT